VEDTELDKFKNIITKSGFKSLIFQSLLNKLDNVTDWDDLQKIQLIQTDIDFESKKDLDRADETQKRYDEEPSQFNFWASIAFGKDKSLHNFRDKVEFVINSNLTDGEKYSQLLLDIKILAEKEK